MTSLLESVSPDSNRRARDRLRQPVDPPVHRRVMCFPGRPDVTRPCFDGRRVLSRGRPLRDVTDRDAAIWPRRR